MDSPVPPPAPPQFDPTPVFPDGTSSRRHKHHLHWLPGEVLLLVAILVLVAFFATAAHVRHIGPTFSLSTSVFPSGEIAFLSNNGTSVTPVQNITSGTPKAYTMTKLGTSVIIDAAVGGAKKPYYYLVADPQQKTSNLFSGNIAYPTVSFAQLTRSYNYKYDLSFDPTSEYAAYVVVSTSTDSVPHVAVYNAAFQKETDLGPGIDPIILPGGSYVVLRDGTNIVAHSSADDSSVHIATVATSTPFAVVDPSTLTIATYNAAAKEIQYFSPIAASSTPASVPISSAPFYIFYSDGKLTLAYSTTVSHQTYLALQDLGSTKVTLIHFVSTSTSLPLATYKISIYHD